MPDEESLLAGAEASTPNEESTDTTETTTETAAWYISEGVLGEGDKPDWFKDSKYKSVTAQAEAYAGLESKLGGFTGAPEEGYELSMPDGIEGEWIEGDPLMEGFQTWAKEKGLNQDAFTELLHMYVSNEASVMGVDRESELKAIGDNAQGRLQNIADYARANLSEDEYEGILAATTTAAGVKAVEALIAKTRGPKVPTDMADVSGGKSREEIRAMMADPRYQSDPSFRKQVSAEYERLLGKGPMTKVIG